MNPDWLNIQPRVGVSVGPEWGGPHGGACGVRSNADFIAGRYFFDASQAPPLGRGTFDQAAWVVSTIRSAGLAGPTPSRSRLTPTSVRAGGLYIQMPQDLKNTRVHSWNLAVQHQIGGNLGV